jgi:hypothetical protein
VSAKPESTVGHYAKATLGVILVLGAVAAAYAARKVLLLAVIAFVLAIAMDPHGGRATDPRLEPGDGDDLRRRRGARAAGGEETQCREESGAHGAQRYAARARAQR